MTARSQSGILKSKFAETNEITELISTDKLQIVEEVPPTYRNLLELIFWNKYRYIYYLLTTYLSDFTCFCPVRSAHASF